MKIASAVDHLVPRIPPKVWDRVAQMILNALTVEDGGDEANLVGAAKLYVERYLAETRSLTQRKIILIRPASSPQSTKDRSRFARTTSNNTSTSRGRESRDQRSDCDAFGTWRIEHQA